MRRFLLPAIILVLGCTALTAEQITTVAIIDLSKVIQSYYSVSLPVREYMKMKDDAQADIDRQNKLINQLSEQKLAAMNSGDQLHVAALENEIFQKKQYLQEYVNIKNTQLKDKMAALTDKASFMTEVLQAIENVSLAGGYSVVLDISDKSSTVLWYSKVVDITNDVVERLKKIVR